MYCEGKSGSTSSITACKKVKVELNEHLIAAENTISDKSELVEKDKLFHLMELAMQQLNKEQQLCVELFYLEKKSYAEIAQVTGFSTLQVKSYLQNGKRNLKLIIEKLMNDSITFAKKER